MSFSAYPSDAVRGLLSNAFAELAAREEFLEVDIWRRLADEAKVLYDTAKIKERVREHPVTVETVKTCPQLLDFIVDESQTQYDAERNCTMQGILTYTSAAAAAEPEKPIKPPSKRAKQKSQRMQLIYNYERRYAGEQFGTTASYSIHVVFDYGQRKPLVECAFRNSGRYPVSYYERQAVMASGGNDEANEENESEGGLGVKQDDENEEDHGDEADQDDETKDDEASAEDDEETQEDEDGQADEAQENSDDEDGKDEDQEGEDSESGDDEDDDADGQDDDGQDDQVDGDEGDDTEAMEVHVLDDDEKNWEYVESFEFAQETFEEVHAWLDERKKVSVQDMLGYIVGMPFFEDEFGIDDRIFDIVFDEDDDGDDGDEGGEETS
ncbi:hypothetical protein LEN26_018421 [Aphanomyces euteiches]|nr:hypothetical protein LEN26_018421 [Aphanomyces euteiches]KAH9121318.1 hypothetical protein AeMF1_006900 [Aphanomyces euteiches]KAH9181083.1 hypothetical protein AeNC1_016943 [Aphanomyces euteiches]